MSSKAKQQKQAIIDEIKKKLENAQSAVIIDYMGITVAQVDEMRKKLHKAGIDYKVYKNTLLKKAVQGTRYAPLSDVLEGPSAIAISRDDATAPARALSQAIDEYKKMAFKAGIVEGNFYDKEGIEKIAAIPSRDGLIAEFMGSLKAPLGKFVRLLQAVADQRSGAEA